MGGGGVEVGMNFASHAWPLPLRGRESNRTGSRSGYLIDVLGGTRAVWVVRLHGRVNGITSCHPHARR